MIFSDIVYLNSGLTREEIEKQLADKCGEVIRWAIIGVSEDKFRISISYIKGV